MTTQAPQPPAPILPKPQPLKLEPIQWQVVPGEQTLFALPPKGYEAMSRNMAEITRWVQEAGWQLDFYRRNRGGAAKP